MELAFAAAAPVCGGSAWSSARSLAGAAASMTKTRQAIRPVPDFIPTSRRSLHEAAPACGARAERVVERVVQSKQAAQSGREPALHLGIEQRLLMLLLRLVPAAVEGVQGPARPLGAVTVGPVPGVGVHDHHGPGAPGENDLARMRRDRIRKRLLGEPSPALRAGDDPYGAVVARDVIQHPDRIAHPVPQLVPYGGGVAVKRLRRRPRLR